MSIEMYVFFRGKLPSKTALTRAMKELGFPFTIKPATGSLDQQHGYMPMLLRRDETGVGFDVYDDPSEIAEFADEGVDPSLDRMASFRWAGDRQEMVAGMCCAAALAKLVNGVVFDAEECKLRSVNEAIAFAKSHLDAITQPEEARRPGTRPADIKRYLKPLLKLRPDLALVGRHLLIRPVRHLLRGAFLDRTGDKYEFRIYRFISPLYEPPGYVRQGDEIHRGKWKVYEPYFEPLLLDSLAEDVLEDLGRIRAMPETEGIDRYTALVLWGQIDQATEFINEVEQTRSDSASCPSWVEKQRWVLANGIPALCEEHHKKELETAKAMKLGDIWEPSPFPVELSGPDRESKVNEPLFVTKPWVSLPPNLWQEMPESPGEVRFAMFILDRGGRKILWMPLTAEEAGARHQGHQNYVLAARLTNGALVCLRHWTSWSPHDPVQPFNPDYVPRRDFHLDIYGPTGRISASIDEDLDKREVVRLYSAAICAADRKKWSAFNNFRESEVSIRDSRGGEELYSTRPMTDSDVSLCRFQQPSFGDFWTLLSRVHTFLMREGVDDFLAAILPTDH
jgi:hypothetical protein